MPALTTNRIPVPSAAALERALAILFVLLTATYAVGTLAEGTLPALHATGVFAIHAAVLVALLIPLTVLGHTATERLRGTDTTNPTETTTAALTVTLLAATLLDAAEPYADFLIALAAATTLLLAALIIKHH